MVVAWLAERGIAAQVKDRYAAETVFVQQAVAPAGIEVVVLNANQAHPARQLLIEHFEESPAGRQAADSSGPPVEAVCEECGRTATFTSDKRGRVEDCPYCGAYSDVPE